MQYLKLKIEGYKKQDMEAKRTIDKEKYIDDDWLFKQIEKNKNCPLCHSNYYIALDDENNVRCNISVDRLNNDLEHTKENCNLLCVECNSKKR